MVTVVLLIGRRNSGKTKTLKKYFGVHQRWRRDEYVDKHNGKIVCAVGHNSPQELIEFCNYERVINNINERLEKAKKEVKRKYNKDDFVFVIPFSLIMKRNGKKNEDCILKPIKNLKDNGYFVFPIYLKRQSKNPWYDLFMKNLTSHEIFSREEYDKQAIELEKLILSL